MGFVRKGDRHRSRASVLKRYRTPFNLQVLEFAKGRKHFCGALRGGDAVPGTPGSPRRAGCSGSTRGQSASGRGASRPAAPGARDRQPRDTASRHLDLAHRSPTIGIAHQANQGVGLQKVSGTFFRYEFRWRARGGEDGRDAGWRGRADGPSEGAPLVLARTCRALGEQGQDDEESNVPYYGEIYL